MYINKSPRRIDRKAGGRNKKIKNKYYPKINKKQKRISSDSWEKHEQEMRIQDLEYENQRLRNELQRRRN